MQSMRTLPIFARPNLLSPSGTSQITTEEALLPAERILAALTLCVAAICAAQAIWLERPLDWNGLGISAGIWGFLIMLGVALRRTLGLRRIGNGLVAFGLCFGYAKVNAILNYLQFPLARPLIDTTLMAIDGYLGYSWEGLVNWLARYPDFSVLLRQVYLSFIWQIMAVLFLLAALNRVVALHRMLLTGTISLLACVILWTIAPSFGPAVLVTIDPEIARQAALVVNQAYVAEMLHLAERGPQIISSGTMIGTIAFPSAHTFLTLLAVVYAWRTFAFWPLALLFCLMVPAILAHGGHHLVDVFGGIALFILAAAISHRVIKDEQNQPDPV